MTRPAAFLVDAYQTIVTCDFETLRNELPVMADVPAQDWHDGFTRLGPALTDGRISLARAFEQILRDCGARPRPGLVAELVRRDRDLRLASGRLFDDAIPFLTMLRDRGVMIAIVSNCTEHTRELLGDLGVSALAESLVLSCEAGCAKPSARIYQQALDQLGADAGRAVFVDDQAAFCAGAAVLGIRAVQIVRGGDGESTAGGIMTVSSLLQAGAVL